MSWIETEIYFRFNLDFEVCYVKLSIHGLQPSHGFVFSNIIFFLLHWKVKEKRKKTNGAVPPDLRMLKNSYWPTESSVDPTSIFRALIIPRCLSIYTYIFSPPPLSLSISCTSFHQFTLADPWPCSVRSFPEHECNSRRRVWVCFRLPWWHSSSSLTFAIFLLCKKALGGISRWRGWSMCWLWFVCIRVA